MVPYSSKQHNSKEQIWVFGDLRNQRLMEFSCNVLAKARKLATDSSRDLVLVLFDGGRAPTTIEPFEDESVSVESIVDRAADHGADHIFCFENDCFNPPQAHIFTVALAEAIRQYQPSLCLFALTDFGRDLAARTAAISKMGLAADCAEIALENGRVIGLCPAWGGSVMAKITFADDRTTGLATVQPFGKFEPPAKGFPGVLQRQPIEVNLERNRMRLISRQIEPACKRQLEEAETVVVGGMGLSAPQGFGLLKKLAAVLGGQVAATRPPVLNGWVADDLMLGQTGKQVKPKLLFSVGTSGAIQYTAGIMESGFIVAINRDPSALIFQIADMGIVADAACFLPLLIEKVKQVMMRSLAHHWRGDYDHGKAASVGTFGEKILKLRHAQQWTCQDLAEATGQTQEFIKKIEANAMLPPASFLLRLAAVLKVAPDVFLNRRSKIAIHEERMTTQVRRTHNCAYQPLTDSTEHDHLSAFILTIEPRKSHKSVAYKHEGEEFILVQSGSLELTLGAEIYVLEKGDSRHFNSNIPHKLKNLSTQPTQCLVVLYTV